MDRKSTIIAGIIGTGAPLQSVVVARTVEPDTSHIGRTWKDNVVTYNLIGGAVVTTVTILLLVRRFLMHAYRDWLSIRAARKAAKKLEMDIEVIAKRVGSEAEKAGVTLETIHPPKS